VKSEKGVYEITVEELSSRMKSGDVLTIIDVREPFEYNFAHIEGAVLKPLPDLMEWAGELDKDQEYVLQCHTGSRSAYATTVLTQMGFKQVKNLVGGIAEWSARIDPNVPQY
jgi:rhodanese-related sulfurtransferase